jgi:hypothetical protein
MQVLLAGWVLDGEGRVEVLDAMGLGEGLSEGLVGAFRAGDVLIVVRPPRDAVVCVLLHPAGPGIMQVSWWSKAGLSGGILGRTAASWAGLGA